MLLRSLECVVDVSEIFLIIQIVVFKRNVRPKTYEYFVVFLDLKKRRKHGK